MGAALARFREHIPIPVPENIRAINRRKKGPGTKTHTMRQISERFPETFMP